MACPPRGRRLAALALVALIGLGGSACGEETLGPATSSLPAGAPLDARRYLADSAGAAEAIRDFSQVLAGLDTPVVAAELPAAARRLRDPLERVARVAQRLEAAHLADRRLEAQRTRAAPLLAATAGAMQNVLTAAQAADPRAMARATDDLRGQVAALNAGLAAAATP